MSFATDLVTALERATAGQPIPRVRALHLPPPEAAASKNGEFCALELDDGALAACRTTPCKMPHRPRILRA